MKYEIRYKPAFATVFLTLQPGDRITAEAGAMVSMASRVSMTTQFSGGLISALLKTFLGGESLFVNEFKNATGEPLELVLSQGTIGDVAVVELNNNEICFQPGAYLAHTPGIRMGVSWAGFSSWLSGEGLFKLKLSGKGLVFFGGYGGVTQRRVNGDLVVDTGHLVAYDPQIKMNIQMAGGLVGSVTSGEGLVNRLSGQGRIYLQSRSVDGLVRFVRSKI
ncbi:TIGR00266 family protein [Cyanobacteria bacterium FACHB-502]|uniref:TIGR00266 family protein n=1 Tax=Leptolyngbya sp. GB1-A1 TaxID=2933908 RepID=UPI00199D8A09|nr:TIGR00266 family protein [Cyanobacteria bacterium FACHB-502]